MSNQTKGCPECKLFSLELVDPNFLWWGRLLKKYRCTECGHEEIEEAD